MKNFAVNGAGLGLRRELLQPLESGVPDVVSFFEVSPENWIDIGGRLGKIFRSYTERHTFVAHGLSLSLGGPAPLDIPFLLRLKDFLDEHNFALYTEHLSFCSDEGYHYDLYPIPFTEELVRHVAERIYNFDGFISIRFWPVMLRVVRCLPSCAGLPACGRT